MKKADLKKQLHSTLIRVRKVTPHFIFDAYHYSQSKGGQIFFKNPSSKMIVIGVIGSKGKTTLANMLHSILNTNATPAGLIGTADLKFGSKSVPNHFHKTMPGRWYMHQLLSRMQKQGCRYAIMEVPSEGQANWRHIGINFDVLVFTNVTNELLAVHNRSLKVLHRHNKRVLKKFNKMPRKKLEGIIIPKILIANQDAKDFNAYFKFPASQKYSFSTDPKSDASFKTTTISTDATSISFKLNGQKFDIPMAGAVNVSNAVGAISAAFSLGLELKDIAARLQKFPGVGGRMEVINEGQNFNLIVDYAHEETGIKSLLEWAKEVTKGKIIMLLGAEGGGRDEKKRPIMGRYSAELADIVIVTNVDPYDDDPTTIINDIIKGTKEVRPEQKDIYSIEDRREAIAKALELASKDDTVLITGKGAEQSMLIGEKKIPWDDRVVVREELKKLK